jgi:hypothetical protein
MYLSIAEKGHFSTGFHSFQDLLSVLGDASWTQMGFDAFALLLIPRNTKKLNFLQEGCKVPSLLSLTQY